MQSTPKYLYCTIGYTLCLLMLLGAIAWKVNSRYHPQSLWHKTRHTLLTEVFLPAPANVPAGRNIAFEVGNAVANAPASYLTMLDCCESDEAIADRIAVGQTQCTIIRKQ